MAVISKKTALVWVLIVAGAVVLWKFVWRSGEEAMPSQSSVSGGVMAPQAQQTPEEIMENSQKTAQVKTSYKNPGGSDEVGFVVTVNNDGIITDATAEVLAVNPISKVRQEAFAAAFPEALKGRKLSELSSVDRVGGSSLTTASFNEALSELKAQL